MVTTKSHLQNNVSIRNYPRSAGWWKTERNTHNKVESIKEMSRLQSFILFQNEKYEIATYKGDDLLSKRTEIFGTLQEKET